jgi:hypothetical protein
MEEETISNGADSPTHFPIDIELSEELLTPEITIDLASEMVSLYIAKENIDIILKNFNEEIEENED